MQLSEHLGPGGEGEVWRESSERMVPVLEVATLGGVVPEERRDAAGSRRKILGAARRLFKSRGVDAVSMHEVGREVGRAAGVGQGTLYQRFEHKGVLCSALLAEQIEDFYEETWERVET
jgi:AcrR family transcriptional regulator